MAVFFIFLCIRVFWLLRHTIDPGQLALTLKLRGILKVTLSTNDVTGMIWQDCVARARQHVLGC